MKNMQYMEALNFDNKRRNFTLDFTYLYTILLERKIAKRFSSVKWGVTLRIVWAWFITIPAAAIIAGISYTVMSLL